MHFHVDSGNGIPIYEQISRQVKFAVAAGILPAAELIPSVRELARQLAVNPNTVARAYRDLQTEGVLESVRGEGLRVTASARELCRNERLRLVRERLRSVLREAEQAGLTRTELRTLFRDELTHLDQEEAL